MPMFQARGIVRTDANFDFGIDHREGRSVDANLLNADGVRVIDGAAQNAEAENAPSPRSAGTLSLKSFMKSGEAHRLLPRFSRFEGGT